MNNQSDLEAAEIPSVEEKAWWHCFWPLSPPPPDSKDVRLLAAVEHKHENGWAWHTYLMGWEGVIDALGVSVPSWFMKTGEPYNHLVGDTLNRMLAAASITYSARVRPVTVGDEKFLSVGYFSDEPVPTRYIIGIQIPDELPHNWDLRSLLTMTAETARYTDAVAALSEAMRLEIPRHYRFLALYRALELLIPGKQKRSSWLERYDALFSTLNLDTKSFRNYVPQLRARCAHGADIGRERGIFGIISSGVPPEAFDLLLQAVLEKLSELTGMTMTVQRLDSPAPATAAEVTPQA